jgi:folate-binding protein YgfZ
VSTAQTTWDNWLRQHGAIISARGVVNFTQSTAERRAHGAALIPLLHLSAVEFSGADAAAFLQAQLTNDVSTLEPGDFQASALCDAKGRVLANFLLLRSAQSYTMIVAADLADDVRARLQKYVLRMKVQIALSPQILLGLIGDESAAVAARVLGSATRLAERECTVVGTSHIVRLSTRRCLLLMDPQSAREGWIALAEHARPTGRDVWEVQQIEEAQPLITRATQGLFLPQMLALDRLGAVSFAKGCFPGQEIVARARYLGEVKRRLWKGSAALTILPVEGDAIWIGATGAVPGGTVVNAAMREDGRCALLAVVNQPDSPDLALAGPNNSRVSLSGQVAFGAE